MLLLFDAHDAASVKHTFFSTLPPTPETPSNPKILEYKNNAIVVNAHLNLEDPYLSLKYYYIIVQEVTGEHYTLDKSVESMYMSRYDFEQNSYISYSICASAFTNDNNNITIGDGKMVGSIFNAPLKDDTEYRICAGTSIEYNGVNKYSDISCSNLRTNAIISRTAKISGIVLASVISGIILVCITLAAVSWLYTSYRRNWFHNMTIRHPNILNRTEVINAHPVRYVSYHEKREDNSTSNQLAVDSSLVPIQHHTYL